LLDRAQPVRTERGQPLRKGIDLCGAILASRRWGGEVEVNPVPAPSRPTGLAGI
jgi:hypothetical protein